MYFKNIKTKKELVDARLKSVNSISDFSAKSSSKRGENPHFNELEKVIEYLVLFRFSF